jgi:hypothetical protein
MPHSAHSARRSAGIGHQSSASLPVENHGRRGSASLAIKQHSTSNNEDGQPIFRKAPPRAEVAELQPVASYNVGVIPITQNTANDSVNVIPFVTPPGQGSLQMTASNSTSANDGAATQLNASGSTTNNTPATPNPTTATNANEPGSALDLLVDVRCRPDGILLMHKSGTLRYLHRPITSHFNGSMSQKIAVR